MADDMAAQDPSLVEINMRRLQREIRGTKNTPIIQVLPVVTPLYGTDLGQMAEEAEALKREELEALAKAKAEAELQRAAEKVGREDTQPTMRPRSSRLAPRRTSPPHRHTL